MMLSKEKFSALCRSASDVATLRDSAGIGTYNEKPLHKILKRTVCEDENAFEVKIGSFVADVRHEGRIVEIQTGGFYPLVQKLRYFLENTDDEIVVLHPIDAELTLIRVDPDTGEVIRKKRSPKKERPCDVLCELFYLRELFASPRVSVLIASVRGEEYRFSERVRGRKTGAYDAVYLPKELLETTWLSTPQDIVAVLPQELRDLSEFDAETFGKMMKLRAGRKRSAAISCLLSFGILVRRKEGKKYIYSWKKT